MKKVIPRFGIWSRIVPVMAVLLLLAVGEDNYWAVQGSGLEDSLSSGTLGDLLREYLEPDFAAGNYDSGVKKTFAALYDEVSALYPSGGTGIVQPVPEETYPQENYPVSTGFHVPDFGIAITAFIIIVIVASFISGGRRRGYRPYRQYPPPPPNPFGHYSRGGYYPPRRPAPPPPPPFRRDPPSGGFGGFGSFSSGGSTRGGGVGRSSSFGRSSGFGGSSHSSFGGSSHSGGGGSTRGGGAGRR